MNVMVVLLWVQGVFFMIFAVDWIISFSGDERIFFYDPVKTFPVAT